MGSCGTREKKVKIEEEEKNKKDDEDIESQKKAKEDNKKNISKITDEKATNPIININNLQPNLDNTNTKQKESQKIGQNIQQLPSEIQPLKLNNEGTSSAVQLSINESKQDKNVNIEKKLSKNERLIAPKEGQLFIKTMTNNQFHNLQVLNNRCYPKGEHIILSFGNTLDIFNSFFTSLCSEHQLYEEQPLYNYNIFFESEDNFNYKARGICYNTPNDTYDIYLKSDVNTLFRNNNIIFNTNKKSKNTLNANTFNTYTKVKDFLNIHEKPDEFIKEYNNSSNIEKIQDLLRTESEKCSHLRCLHFLGDIFDGNTMGIFCNFIENIQEDYKKVLKLAHLKYYDTSEHKAFSKIKNYIYSVSCLYNNCDLVNFFNSPMGGGILSCLTGGERIDEYSSEYSINQIISDLLVNPNLNYIYSNGLEIKNKKSEDKYIELLFSDCKEDKSHFYYKSQVSSLTIYKGTNIFNNDSKFKLSDEMSKIVDVHIKNNRSYYNFYDIKKSFKMNDFLSNFHQSQYFARFTENFFMDFIQNYNVGNFTKEEKQLKEETINNVHGLLNNFKEIWRCEV